MKKKVWLVENIKFPTEAGTMCMIHGEMFHMFMKNTWIGDSGTQYHIMNYDTALFDVTEINESIQGSSRNMPTIM